MNQPLRHCKIVSASWAKRALTLLSVALWLGLGVAGGAVAQSADTRADSRTGAGSAQAVQRASSDGRDAAAGAQGATAAATLDRVALADARERPLTRTALVLPGTSTAAASSRAPAGQPAAAASSASPGAGDFNLLALLLAAVAAVGFLAGRRQRY